MSLEGPVAIIGLGLMGGSLARDLAGQGIAVLGFDRTAPVLEAALQSGIIERSLPEDLEGLDAARVVVVATPVDAAAALLDPIARRGHPGAVITDLGSTKRDILRAAADAGIGSRFVGSHPLAGDHRSGWNATRTRLYEGATVFVCPGAATEPAAVDGVEGLWRQVGALPIRQDAAEHDRLMSMVSHLPQVVSTALATVLVQGGFTGGDLGPGGKDVTRLAGSSAEMWTAISIANADNLTAALDRLDEIVSRLRRHLAAGDREGIREFFEAGRKLRG